VQEARAQAQDEGANKETQTVAGTTRLSKDRASWLTIDDKKNESKKNKNDDNDYHHLLITSLLTVDTKHIRHSLLDSRRHT
jgi:hypothetical protein